MQDLSDIQRETLIETYRRLMCEAKTKKYKQQCWRRMADLIRGRSPEQVKRMEADL